MKIESFLRKYFVKVFFVLFLLLIVDILIFSFWSLKLEDRVKQLESKVKKGDEEISSLEKKVFEKEDEVKSFKETKDVIETLKNNIFQKRSERFIPFQKEVERIVNEVGIALEKYDYKYTLYPKDIEKEGWKDGFVEVYMTLPLQGTYPQIKKVISLLEKSGHFITIKGISISQTTQGTTLLDFKVGIATYFTYDPKEDIIEENK